MDKQHKSDLSIHSSELSSRQRRVTLYSLVIICIISIILIAMLAPEGSYKFALIMLLFFGMAYLVNLLTTTIAGTQKTAINPPKKQKQIKRKS